MKYLRNFFALVLILISGNVYGQFFRHLGLKDGLSNLSVISICQDKLGRMWFGTNQGMNIYDGHKMYNITSLQTKYKNWNLLNGLISSIVSNKKGDIFFCNDRQVVKYDIESDSFKSIPTSRQVFKLFVLDGDVNFIVADSLFQHHAENDSVTFKTKLNRSFLINGLAKLGSKLYYGDKDGLYVRENNQTKTVLSGVEISNLLASSLGELWVGTRYDGLYRIDSKGELCKEELSSTRVADTQIREIIEDKEQNIWFGTFKGLQKYNPQTDTYKFYTASLYPGTLSHQSIFSLFYDNNNLLWIGSYYGGVNFVNPNQDNFVYYPSYEIPNNLYLNFPMTNAMVETDNRKLWIATDGGGLNCLDRNTHKYTYFTSAQQNSLLTDNVKTLAYDKERQCLYIGTHLGGLSKYDLKSKRFHHYLTDWERGKKGPSDIIFKCLYRDNFLYVTARNGFWKMDVRTDEFEFITYKNIGQDFELLGEYAYLSTGYCIYKINLSNYQSSTYLFDNEKHIIRNKISHLLVSSHHKLYIATKGDGVYVYDTHSNQINHFTKENSQLVSNTCYALSETPERRLAVTCAGGISLLSTDGKQVYSVRFNSGDKSGFCVSEEGEFCVAPDSTIFLSGAYGIVSFKEEDFIKGTSSKSNLHFSDILVNNQSVRPGDKSGILTKAVPFESEIDLDYNQNNITVTYSSPYYVDLNKPVSYAYKLEGYDDEWITAQTGNITYTNLSPGSYTLKVRELNANDPQNEFNEIALNLKVHRPWFASVPAFLVYILIVSFVVYRFWKISLARKMLAFSLEKEKEDKERIEEVNKMKLGFFTNISHEFRTPLTLIIGQLEMLMESNNLTVAFNKKLQNVYQNASHLRLLINELLDFRKQEQGFLKLKVEHINAVTFVRNVFNSFTEMALQRKIHFDFIHTDEKVDLWVDPVQMQKVVFNLLSNAFKYTPDGHEITVTVGSDAQFVEIAVEDTGYGIAEDDIPFIFNSFYQVEGNRQKEIQGTGIGLSLAKGIVEAHHGTIQVESEVGNGSKFTILLKVNNLHFTSEELNNHCITNETLDQAELECYYQTKTTIAASETENQEKESVTDSEQNEVLPKILLVEDDGDMLQMLVEIFSNSYNVFTANNGQVGFEKAMEIHPDLIVSDVLMPVMSGKEMCYRVKNCLTLAYIPVVLLTALSSDENMIDGYMFGADDYVIKPFNVRLLLVKCRNLIKNRQELLNRIKDEPSQMLVPSSSLSQNNQLLINKATEIIKNNFSNLDFNMNMLASELNLGRSKMYTSIKDLTGLTPNEFMLKLKFEEAVRLLKEHPDYNISEISYQLGFVSPAYFTRCFKSFYGVAPNTYRKNN